MRRAIYIYGKDGKYLGSHQEDYDYVLKENETLIPPTGDLESSRFNGIYWESTGGQNKVYPALR